jgi:hypothetical protein
VRAGDFYVKPAFERQLSGTTYDRDWPTVKKQISQRNKVKIKFQLAHHLGQATLGAMPDRGVQKLI